MYTKFCSKRFRYRCHEREKGIVHSILTKLFDTMSYRYSVFDIWETSDFQTFISCTKQQEYTYLKDKALWKTCKCIAYALRYRFPFPKRQLFAVRDCIRRFHHKIDETVNILELFRVKFRSNCSASFVFRYHGEGTFCVCIHLYRFWQFQFQLLLQSWPFDQESTLSQWDG